MVRTKSCGSCPTSDRGGKPLARDLIYKATIGCKSSSAYLEAFIPSHCVVGDSMGSQPLTCIHTVFHTVVQIEADE
jgi:hypothetical protein